MGRFETRWLTAEKNLSALADLSGKWIDSVHGRRPPRGILLDMDFERQPDACAFRASAMQTWDEVVAAV